MNNAMITTTINLQGMLDIDENKNISTIVGDGLRTISLADFLKSYDSEYIQIEIRCIKEL